jgi:SAM-dependent methyltransferase
VADSADPNGHRQVELPNVARALLVGRTVLDVGCRDGAWAFRALDLGAAHAVGIDGDPEEIERAEFAAELRGDDNVTFHLGDVDGWLAERPEVFDHVLLHRFPGRASDPLAGVRAACGLTRDGLFLQTDLCGGPAGFRPLPESDGLIPNTTRSVLEAFRQHGFLPVHIEERRRRLQERAWGDCLLFLRRCPAPLASAQEPEPGSPIELQLVPAGSGELDLVLYNWSEEELCAVGELVLEDPDGHPVAEPELRDFELVPRLAETSGSSSRSLLLPLRLDERTSGEGRPARLRATVRDRRTGRVLAQGRVPLER